MPAARARPSHTLAAHALGRALGGGGGGGGGGGRGGGSGSARGSALKALTLGSPLARATAAPARRAAHALLCESLRHACVVRAALARLRASDGAAHAALLDACGGDQHLLHVLAYDAALGAGLRERSAPPAERALAVVADVLRREVGAAVREAGYANVGDALPPVPEDLPRYARVNYLKAARAGETLAQAAGGVTRELQADGHAAEPAVEPVALMPEVLRLPPGTDLHEDARVALGTLVQQSLASCLPARALAPRAGWTVVDGCAAPGNKTTHLAALLAEAEALETPEGDSLSDWNRKRRTRGRVIALDRDAVRLQRLRTNARATGADGIISAHVADFLSPPPAVEAELAKADAVLLDPSCSGSGTGRSRGDFLIEAGRATLGELPSGGAPEVDAAGDTRVEKLAAFQLAAVTRAMRLPRARRLVYSTCSVHRQENEDVVEKAMEVGRAHGWKLGEALPGWPCRGLGGDWQALCARAGPERAQGATDGFFVALFERDSDERLAIGARAREDEGPQPARPTLAAPPAPAAGQTPASKKRKLAPAAGGAGATTVVKAAKGAKGKGKRRRGGIRGPAILR